VPFMKIGCCLILLFVKSICTDLHSLRFIKVAIEDFFSLWFDPRLYRNQLHEPCLPSLENIKIEMVRYGHEFHETQTQERVY
jgi:hypothetical protein